MYRKSDYSYSLPEERIAQVAIHPHHDARLMVVSRETGEILDESTFWELASYIPPNRVLYFNNSRVEKARIRLNGHNFERTNGERGTIPNGEILFTEKGSDGTFSGMVRPGKKFRVGTKIFFGKGSVTVVSETETGRTFLCHDTTIEEIMENYGELPLPPYIEYNKEKESDYQTSFASKDGSVAAPTASLHFTKELLQKLPEEKHFLTLHVGLGTFKGLDTEDVRDYMIHSERVEIDASLFETLANEKNSGKKILAIGTTSCRTLESLPHLWKLLEQKWKNEQKESTQAFWDTQSKDISVPEVHDIIISNTSIQFKTKIYIYPGIPFRIIDELITNFHLPESSLLLLVGAFTGRDHIMNLYKQAIEKGYRFFSFGDGMYIREN